jgi:hypothetical protein
VEFSIKHVGCLPVSARGLLSPEGSKFRTRDPYELCISRKTKGLDKVARFLRSQEWFTASYLQGVSEVRRMKSEYDLDSAITFLLVGLGIGSVLGIVFNAKLRVPPEGTKGVNGWRTARLQRKHRKKQSSEWRELRRSL